MERASRLPERPSKTIAGMGCPYWRQTLRRKSPQEISPKNQRGQSTLARLKARIFLVDHIGATFAANNAAVLVTYLHGFDRVDDFHDLNLDIFTQRPAAPCVVFSCDAEEPAGGHGSRKKNERRIYAPECTKSTAGFVSAEWLRNACGLLPPKEKLTQRKLCFDLTVQTLPASFRFLEQTGNNSCDQSN